MDYVKPSFTTAKEREKEAKELDLHRQLGDGYIHLQSHSEQAKEIHCSVNNTS